MFGTCKKGFTLIEILVALAIVAIIMGVALPKFKTLMPGAARKQFVNNANALVRTAWQHALKERLVYKVVFHMTNRRAWLEKQTKSVKNNEPTFERVKGSYTLSSFTIPKTIQIKQFIIEGYDEMSRRQGDTDESWFYIMPDGLTQAVTINFNDTGQKNRSGRPRQFGLVLNPFNAQFTLYGSFQK